MWKLYSLCQYISKYKSILNISGREYRKPVKEKAFTFMLGCAHSHMWIFIITVCHCEFNRAEALHSLPLCEMSITIASCFHIWNIFSIIHISQTLKKYCKNCGCSYHFQLSGPYTRLPVRLTMLFNCVYVNEVRCKNAFVFLQPSWLPHAELLILHLGYQIVQKKVMNKNSFHLV